MVDTESGEFVERRLDHRDGEAQEFYSGLQRPVRVGMEATGYAQWFERMLTKLGYELWIGDAAEIRAAMVRKQKTDLRDARHMLDLLLANRFPRIWIPSPAERDVRQLLRQRHKMVCQRTSVRNQLQALAMGQGVCRKRKLWAAGGRTELEGLGLDPMGESPTAGTVADTRPTGSLPGGVGWSGSQRSRATPSRPLLDGTGGRGSGDSLDVRADDRASGALPAEQSGSELSRAESPGE